ncbi:hypothetical protein SNE40_003803 [Patella caerulea]
MDKEITVSDVWLPTEDKVLSPDAVRKAASRATKSLPKNPQKFACVLERVIHKASPRKRQAFEQLTKGDSSDPVVEEIKRLKTQKDRKSIIKRRCFIKTMMKKYKNCYVMSRATNIKYDYLRKCRKVKEDDVWAKRSDQISEDTKKKLRSFIKKKTLRHLFLI